MTNDPSLPKAFPLRRLLRQFDWIQRVLAIVERLALGILLTVGLISLVCLFDRCIDVDGFWRQPFPWLTLGLGAATVLTTAAVLIRRSRYDALAHRLDRLRGDQRDQLRSAVDFAGRDDGGGPLGKISQAAALNFWQHTRPLALAPRRRAVLLSVAAMGFLLLVGSAAMQSWMRAPLLWQRFLDPTGNYPRPTATWFKVAAPATISGGDDFVLTARLAGRPVEVARPLARIQGGDRALIVRPLVRQEDGSWRLSLPEVQAPFTCVLVMGNVRSEEHRIAVNSRPTIAEVKVTYDYPKYSGLRAETRILAGRTLTALEGTKARIVATANLPLAKFDARSGEDRLAFTINSRQPEEATRFHFLSRNERLDVVLTARNGLESKGELPFNIRAIPDAPPTVQITAKDLDRAYFAHEILSIPCQAQDDLGLAEVSIRDFRPAQKGFVPYYNQELELARYGTTRAEAVMRIPVSQLLWRSDLQETKLRLQATDLKGQTTMSQALTIRIAVNSYDRQLRTARNTLQGEYMASDLSLAGFPNLTFHGTDRLTAIRTLLSKLLILAEDLDDAEKVGERSGKDVQNLRAVIQQLDPRPRFLLPSIGPRPDDRVPSLTFLAERAMTPRLARLMAETTCGGDLAIPGEAIGRQFEAALVAENPKAELVKLRAMIEPLLARQEDLAQRLLRARQFLELELAGTLAAGLSRDLATTDADRWADRDFLLSTRRKRQELADLLTSNQPMLPDLPLPAYESLAKVAADVDPATLRGLAEPLQTINGYLASTAAAWALREPEWRLPLDQYDTGAVPQEKWLDVEALALLMAMDDEGRDEIAYTWQAAQQVDRRGARTSAWPGISPQAERNLQLFILVSRIAEISSELRDGLLAGSLAPEDPAAESLWILLRERRFDLLRLLGTEVENSTLAAAAAPLITSGQPLTQWTIPAEPPTETAEWLATWAAAARNLAELTRKPARETISTASRYLAERWEPLMLAGLESYRRDIADRIREIQAVRDLENQNAVPNAVFGPLPQMFARLKAMQIFVLQCLNLATLDRVETGNSAFPEERLMAVTHLLRQAEKDLFTNVGSPIGNAFLTKQTREQMLKSLSPEQRASILPGSTTKEKETALATAAAAQEGKVKTYRSLDGLMADIEALVQPGVTVEAAEQKLAHYVVAHLYDLDRKEQRLALAQLAPLSADLLVELKGDREGAPLLWQAFLTPLAKVADEHGRAAASPGLPWNSLLANLEALGELPKWLDGLRDVLGQLAKHPASFRGDDLPPVLDSLREMARPPVVPTGSEVLTHRRRSVLRERIGLALGLPDSTAAAVQWAVVEMEWSRRKAVAAEKNVGIAGLAVGGDDDLAALKLPRHLYLELKRAREHAMPELFHERCSRYLNTILETAR